MISDKEFKLVAIITTVNSYYGVWVAKKYVEKFLSVKDFCDKSNVVVFKKINDINVSSKSITGILHFVKPPEEHNFHAYLIYDEVISAEDLDNIVSKEKIFRTSPIKQIIGVDGNIAGEVFVPHKEP